MGGYKLPTFLEVYEDDAGTRRIRIGARPLEEGDEQMVWDHIHQQSRDHKVTVEDGGGLTGPMSETEINLLKGLCKGKTPGLSGFKISSLQVFPEWVFELFVALVNATMVLGLIPNDLKQILVVCIPKPTSGYRPLSMYMRRC